MGSTPTTRTKEKGEKDFSFSPFYIMFFYERICVKKRRTFYYHTNLKRVGVVTIEKDGVVAGTRKILRICLILFFLCFAILKTISIMNPNNEYYFLVGKLGGKTAEPVMFTLALISLCLMLILSEMKNRYKIIVIGFGLITVISTFILSVFLGSIDYYRYFYFNSPDKKNTIAVAEWSYLLGGGADCYVRENPFFVRRLAGSMGTDDGYRTFSNKTYKVNWLDNQTVTFEYGNGHLGVSTDIFVLDEYWDGSQK